MGRVLKIPPPILEENRDEYLEELSSIKQAEDWVEKHSVEDYSNRSVNVNENYTELTIEHEPPRTVTAIEILRIVILTCFIISLPLFCLHFLLRHSLAVQAVGVMAYVDFLVGVDLKPKIFRLLVSQHISSIFMMNILATKLDNCNLIKNILR